MKILWLVPAVFILSCGKQECQTCSAYYEIQGGTTFKQDTIYKNVEYCGEDLDRAKSKDGNSSTTQVGSTTYRYTTRVSCR